MKSEENIGLLLEELAAILVRLRDPKSGCPWDLKQTPMSIARYSLEETYELLEAIAQDNLPDICEELGDLLFQIIFLSQLFKEKGDFTLADVISTINQKMIRRHPHIFADTILQTVEEVEWQWQQIKKKEKAENNNINECENENPIQRIKDIVRDSMPPIKKTHEIQKHAINCGFDWPDIKGALTKLEEEVKELRTEIERNHKENIEAELGDVLFSVCGIAERYQLSAEMALIKTNHKFMNRFSYIEEQLIQQQRSWHTSNLEEMDRWWNEVKLIEGK